MNPENPDHDETLIPEDIQEELRAKMEQQQAEMADKLSEETLDEFGTIGGDITPEMLASMDPLQLQQLMGLMGGQKRRRTQADYTRNGPSQWSKAKRVAKRRAQRRARKISLRKGGGRTISRKRRLKKAA